MLRPAGAELCITDAQLLTAAGVVAAQLAHRGVRPGDRVLILCPPGLSFIAALFGSMAAGAIAVPTYPPRFAGSVERLLPVVENARPTVAIAAADLIETLAGTGKSPLSDAPQVWSGITWLALSDREVLTASSRDEQLMRVGANPLAVLQYTSGSTSAPKGVRLSHENLISNSRLIAAQLPEYAKGVNWLPPYHDMGLIGSIFTPLAGGIESILMTPDMFLRKPLRWLEAISRFGGTTCGGPDFAYSLCARRISNEQKEGLDLSSWVSAFCGAERVRKPTIDAFCEAFEPWGFDRRAFTPCYGLAESTLCISFGERRKQPSTIRVNAKALAQGLVQAEEDADAPDVLEIVGCGPPMPGQELRLVNPTTLEVCGPNEVGEIWVSSASVADGYFELPELSAEVFENKLPGEEFEFLRTGDLGALIAGELFVTGRLKELVVIAGRNYHPEDLEEAVAYADPAFCPGGGVVFSIDDGQREHIILLQEVERRGLENANGAIHEARDALLRKFDLGLAVVLLVPRGSLPRTTSGKLQRKRAKELYLCADVKVLFDSRVLMEVAVSMVPTSIERRLAEVIQEVLDISTIDPHEDFFALGVQSILATQLVAKVREEFGVEVPLRTVFEEPTLAQMAVVVSRLAPAPDLGPKDLLPLNSELALTASQERMWFLHQLDPMGSAYNVAGALHLSGAIRLDWLESSLAKVWARHDILRSVYHTSKDGPRMTIQPARPIELPVVGLRNLVSKEEASEIGSRLAKTPFDLGHGPLWRVEVYVLQSEEQEEGDAVVTECMLAVCFHHIVADGWSLNVVLREVIECYRAQAEGRESELPDMNIQYADYAHWHRRSLNDGLLEKQLGYWRKQLAGLPELTEIPTDYPRPPLHQQGGALCQHEFSAGLTSEIVEYARRKRVTPFMVLLACFQVLLRNYTRTTDIVVGTPIANRRWHAAEHLVGTLVNTLVLRTDLGDNPTFAEHLARLKDISIEAFANQDLPFEQLVEELRVPRHADRTPLFQVMFDHQVFEIPETEVAGIRLRAEPIERDSTQVDLGVSVVMTGDRFLVAAGYRTDLFSKLTVERMCENYEALVCGAIESDGIRVEDIPWLSHEERAAIIESSHGPKIDLAPETVVESILHWASTTPLAPAVQSGAQTLTYAELEARSAALAQLLRGHGVGPQKRVGVCLKRSTDLLVALVGIWRTGASYVPLDPAYPAQRIQMMTEDAPLSALLGHSELTPVWQELALNCPIELMDGEDFPNQLDASARFEELVLAPDSLAYVMFTSGSTGRPKGVQVTHRNVANIIQSMGQTLELTQEDRLAAVTTIAFDISILELFLPLSYGAVVDVLPREVSIDSARLQARLAQTGPTLMQGTPATWRLLLDGGWEGSESMKVLCGGEALSTELAERLVPRCAQLWNVYGPTETTVWSTMAHVTDGSAPISIGRPIANTQCHVLDSKGRRVPCGVVGELFIGGSGVTEGYIGRDDLTAERFVPDPFVAVDEETKRVPSMYRTGDLVKQRADGSLMFLGRSDSQVKVRGYRIELGEIESRLASHPEVKRCVVDLREFGEGDTRLVGYWTPENQSVPATELKDHILGSLPQYMVPSHFVELASFPLTPNGKVDRKALPQPLIEVQVQPAELDDNPTTELVAEVWAALLGARPGPDEDFFEMGGHSLLVVQLLGELARRTGVRLPVNVLFGAPTVRGLATLVEEGRQRLARLIVPLSEGAAAEPSTQDNPGASVFWIHAGPETLSAEGGSLGVLRQRLQAVWGPDAAEYSLLVGGEPYAHLPSLAGEYVGALAVHQGRAFIDEEPIVDRPLILVGHGYSGNLALEVATQLAESGMEGVQLVLLDCALPPKDVARRSWGRATEPLPDSALPGSYGQLVETERLAWLSHQPGKYGQRLFSISSAGFRGTSIRAIRLPGVAAIQHVEWAADSLEEASDSSLNVLKNRLNPN